MSEMNVSFTQGINKNFNADPSESVFEALFREYEHVIYRSIITSFGLDVFIQDQYGGDVDTILGVRSIENDPLVKYKSIENKAAYEHRGVYAHKDVEKSGSNFQKKSIMPGQYITRILETILCRMLMKTAHSIS